MKGNTPNFGRLETAFEHGEASMQDYLKKTSLSPWVPLPDAACRKIFDLANAGPDDIHVDLGSGDGRVCFHAIDFGLKKSTGIDVDEAIVAVAQERLAKRHPPPDLQFIVADLSKDTHVFDIIREATIITMYFAQDALEQFRPLLERELAGSTAKILTCGYEMPGWESSMSEVVLGTQIHLYEFGSDSNDLLGEDLVIIDDIIKDKPAEMMQEERFNGAKVIDHTGKHPIRGFNPDLFDEKDDDSDWEDEDDEEESSEEKQGKSASKTS